MVLGAGAASGQNYPVKPVRVVSIGAGGGGDIAARLIAQRLSASLGRQVIVDNRGGGLLAGEIVAKAPPDGYTLLSYGSTIWLLPLLQDNVSYDPVRDFAPISLVTRSPNILVVHPSVPAKSTGDLIALARARPGDLNYASGATGAITHLAVELFKSMAGVNFTKVNYKGSGAAANALLAGEVQLMFPSAGTAAPHIRSGRFRALAVTSAEPSALAPGLPTVAASGLPGYEAVAVQGMFAPAGTPASIINRLHREIVQVLNSADVKEKLFNVGIEVVGSSPEQFAAMMKSDMAKWGKVIKDAGIRTE